MKIITVTLKRYNETIKSYTYNQSNPPKEMLDYLFVCIDLADFLYEIEAFGNYDSDDDEAPMVPNLYYFYIEDIDWFLTEVKNQFEIVEDENYKCIPGKLDSIEDVYYNLLNLCKEVELDQISDRIIEFEVEGNEREQLIVSFEEKSQEFINFLIEYWKYLGKNEFVERLKNDANNIHLFTDSLRKQKPGEFFSSDVTILGNFESNKEKEDSKFICYEIEDEPLQHVRTRLVKYACKILGREDIDIDNILNLAYISNIEVSCLDDNSNTSTKIFKNHVEISRFLMDYLKEL